MKEEGADNQSYGLGLSTTSKDELSRVIYHDKHLPVWFPDMERRAHVYVGPP